MRTPIARAVSGLNSKANSFVGTNESFFSLASKSAFYGKMIASLGEVPIVHVHNWFNLLCMSDIECLLRQGNKLIFTLHDTRLLTGGCHSTLNCDGFLRGCGMCPNVRSIVNRIPSLNVKRLRHIFFENKERIDFVVPSRYLQRSAINSYLLDGLNLTYIPNCHSSFGQGYKSKIRNPKTLVVGVASADPKSILKGGDIISEVQNSTKLSEKNIRILQLSECEAKLSEGNRFFWENIDVLLVPSRFDNSPNVIHEAKTIGIPVIASKVGGIEEMLEPNFDLGFEIEDLVPPKVEEMIIHFSESFIDTQKQKEVIAKQAISSTLSIEGHLKLYERTLL